MTHRAAYSSPPPLQRSSSGKRQRREPSPDYVPQPSKKKRERLHSPQPRSEPAVRGQPAGPPPDAPEEVSVSVPRFRRAVLLAWDVLVLKTAIKVCGLFFRQGGAGV